MWKILIQKIYLQNMQNILDIRYILCYNTLYIKCECEKTMQNKQNTNYIQIQANEYLYISLCKHIKIAYRLMRIRKQSIVKNTNYLKKIFTYLILPPMNTYHHYVYRQLLCNPYGMTFYTIRY